MDLMKMFTQIFVSNGLVMSFLVVGIVMYLAYRISDITKGRIHGSAIAILLGLILAYIGGVVTGKGKGLADITLFSGIGLMGGGMLRDYAIISTAFGADLNEMKKCGVAGIVSLLIGIVSAYIVGVALAYVFGYTDTVSMATIGAGAVTFIVGPVTGAALGASSAVIAISIAAGVVKSIFVMILTPMVAKSIGYYPGGCDGIWWVDGYNQWHSSWFGCDRSKTCSIWCNDCDILYRTWLFTLSIHIVPGYQSDIWLIINK